MSRKWRPSLWLVVGGALAGTLALSFVGLIVLRYLGPEIGFRQAAALIAALIAVVTAGLGALMVRLLLRPVFDLARYARTVRRAPRGTATPPLHYGTSELRDLAEDVQDMARTLQQREQTVRSFSDHATHELKTPIAAIRAASELILDDPTLGPDNRALVKTIDQAQIQLQAQLETLQAVARARETHDPGPTTLDEIADTLQSPLPDLTIIIQGAARPLPLGRDLLAMVLTHLLRNARQAGATNVTLTAHSAGHLSVEDNGNGVSDGNLDRLMEPFFTTRRDQGGTGMGLTIAAAVMTAHGGRIELSNSGRNGTTFTLHFAAM